MPNITCPQRIDCPCTEEPGTNYSSEAPDRIRYIGLNFGWNNIPGLGKIWSRSYCFGVCISDTSQEEADLCAASASVICNPPPTLPPECEEDPSICDPGTVFYNRAQSASSSCPDGSQSFTYTVPAGSIAADSQEMADRIALSIATNNARIERFCVSPKLSGGNVFNCIGDAFFGDDPWFTVTGKGAPFTFTISAGALPDGISLVTISSKTAGFFGMPTTPGNSVFTLKVTSSTGFVIEQQYTYSVMGVTNSPLPDATEGVAYSEQIQVSGGTAPYTFALAAGSSLPAGLSMSASGLITGTP